VQRILWTAPVAVLLFLAGGAGVFRLSEPARPPVPPAAPAVLLAPGSPGDLDSVIAGLQARLRQRSGDWRGLASLGLAYLQKGRLTAEPSYYPKAQALLGRSLQVEPNNFDAVLGMGILALGRHDFDTALRWGRAARALNTANAQALGVIGDALLELGRYPASARAFQLMVDLRPDTASYARVSYYRELTGDVAGALDAMRMARDMAGTPGDAAWAGYQLGELLFGAGRLRGAARAYGAAAAVDPAALLPEVGMARVAAARGHLDRAIGRLETVVARQPAAEFVILLGDLLRAAGRGSDAAGRFALVEAMDGLNMDAGVDTDLEMALFDADHGRAARAVRRATTVYRARPSVQAADALAWALYSADRFEAAGRYADEALRLGTRSASFHFHAGMIAAALGDEARAERHLRRALSINPWFSVTHGGTARATLNEVSG
jgi:tetratricopeptide (TPR) repeat protein